MTWPVSAVDLLVVLGAVPLAAAGGATFLSGVLGVAAQLRLPKLLVATTLAAFATSGPEMAVSSLAALAGRPGIGLGDALGSNVVNAGLILGVALLFGPLPAPPASVRRDFALALAVPVLTLVLALDGTVSRADGALLLGVFVVWMTAMARRAIAERADAPAADAAAPDAAPRGARPWLLLAAGLAGLIAAGRLFVSGASGIALAVGVHPYVIGATVVALGTSLPELVTVVLARRRGHADVGLGTLLGSNLFNGLAVVGVAASIRPIDAPPREVAVAAAFGVATLLLVATRGATLRRRRGLGLVAAYAAFVAATAAGAH